MGFIESFGGLTEVYHLYNGQVELRYDKENHEYLLVEDGKLIPIPPVTSIIHIIDKSNALVPWAAKKVAEKFVELAPNFKFKNLINGVEVGWDYIELKDIPKLAEEAKKAPREEKEEAADIGAQAHAWIESYIKRCISGEIQRGSTYSLPEHPQVRSCVDAALSWMNQHNVRWICTEKKVYSKYYRYAGTLDGKAYVDSCTNTNCCPYVFTDRLSLIDWKSSNYLYLEFLLQTAAYQYADQEETGLSIEDIWVVRLGKEDGIFEPWHIFDNAEQLQNENGFFAALRLYSVIKDIENVLRDKKNKLKEIKKLEKQKEKEEQLKIKCKGADKYKGIRYPKCNGGNPCQTCLAIYKEKHPNEI